MITDTRSFQAALATGDVDGPETWLNNVKDRRDLYLQYDDRAIDHREAELLHAFFGKDLFDRAAALIESSVLESSKEPRRKRLAEEQLKRKRGY